jgi:hypothetical protein
MDAARSEKARTAFAPYVFPTAPTAGTGKGTPGLVPVSGPGASGTPALIAPGAGSTSTGGTAGVQSVLDQMNEPTGRRSRVGAAVGKSDRSADRAAQSAVNKWKRMSEGDRAKTTPMDFLRGQLSPSQLEGLNMSKLGPKFNLNPAAKGSAARKAQDSGDDKLLQILERMEKSSAKTAENTTALKEEA